LKLIIAIESLTPPLTGIGYYTAHLVDEMLKSAEIDELYGIDHHGLINRQQLMEHLWKNTDGELGEPITTAALHSEQQVLNINHRKAAALQSTKAIIKKIPGAYAFARYYYARRAHASIKGHPDCLLHAPNYIPPQHAGPTVVTVHDLSHIRHPETHPQERVQWLNQHLPQALDSASHIISVSEFTRQELLDLGMVKDIERISVCYNGCDEGFRLYEKDALEPELSKWGLTVGRYILSVATLEPRKNMERVLDAYESLPPEIAADYPLVLTGTAGWKNNSLRQRIARIKPPHHVITTGYLERQQIQHLMAGAGVFAYLSFYEGFGLPILEAMASGVPVVTANTTSLKEVAADAAYTVDPFDVQAITAALAYFMEDPEHGKPFAAAGLARARFFSWRKCAEETIKAYRIAARQD